ncbi:MAG: hypothetical protein AAF618_08925 [Pseudomonadota bacterium]
MTRIIALLMAAAPGFAFAAGGMSSTPPTSTETTQQCANGFVYDAEAQACVAIQQDSFLAPETHDRAIELVRELAYNDRFADAQVILAAMDQSDDRVQTYWGFTHRKMGNMDKAMQAYYAALVTNPDNLLVHSYMGQAYVEMGGMVMAQEQLTEIRARGGRESWPEKSLAWAIENGKGQSY